MSAYRPRGFIGSIFLLTLILGASFGGFVSAGMMTADGRMQDCPYMGTSGYCPMDIAAHLAGWQQLFATTLERSHSSGPFPSLALLFLIPFFIGLLVYVRPRQRILERWRTLALYDPLQLAFARGLIHPKLYS